MTLAKGRKQVASKGTWLSSVDRQAVLFYLERVEALTDALRQMLKAGPPAVRMR